MVRFVMCQHLVSKAVLESNPIQNLFHRYAALCHYGDLETTQFSIEGVD